MRVFVTGASGFIGQAVVKELIGACHQVTGLARSADAAQQLARLGAKAHAGSLHEPDTLRAGAAAADGVIHLAFIHGPGDIPLGRRLGLILGGSPFNIVGRFGAAITAADRRATDALAGALTGSGRPLVTVFGTMGMAEGRTATEDEEPDPRSPGWMRSRTEAAVKAWSARPWSVWRPLFMATAITVWSLGSSPLRASTKVRAMSATAATAGAPSISSMRRCCSAWRWKRVGPARDITASPTRAFPSARSLR